MAQAYSSVRFHTRIGTPARVVPGSHSYPEGAGMAWNVLGVVLLVIVVTGLYYLTD
jgi:hypothetical protein